MKHQTNREFGFERWFYWALLLSFACGGVQAMTVLPDETVATTLACLERTGKPPQFPENTTQQEGGLMRVKLTFERPDQAPTVEVLANTAAKSMQDQVFQFVSGYRLPCLKAEQGSVQAVQEFVFEGLIRPDGKPLRPLTHQLPAQACIVVPRRELEVQGAPQDTVARVIVQGRFDGDADQSPSISYLHVSGSSKVQRAIGAHLAAYRMPCRKAGDPPVMFEQSFVVVFSGSKPAGFKQPMLPLNQFLANLKGIQSQRIFFDLDTMACPFQLNWTSMRPAAANRVSELGPPNPNRTEFRAWLSTMDINVSSRLLEQLIGESMIVDVPCGKVDLKPSSPPANPT